MVNFNLRLRENVFGEWKNEYIDYAKLKRLVKKQEQLQSASRYFDTENSATPSNYGTMMAKNRITGVRRSRSTSFLHTLAAKAVDASEFQGLVSFPQSDPFEDALEAEYEKVEHAYKTHVAQYAQQLALLQTQYRPNAPFTTQESLKYALVELHRLLVYLNNFALLNYKGFVKILRKHDRAIMPQASSARGFGSSSITHGHRKDLHSYAFVEAHDCRDLQHQVEQTFANFFCEGNRSLAIATLITKKEEFVNWAQIYVGMKIGACIILIVWVVWDSLVVPTFKSSKERHIIPLAATRAYPVYRGIGCLLLLHWLIGLSLYVWSIARINYRYIFELDPRNTQQPAQVFSAATNMTMVFLVNLLLYYKVVNGYFPEEILHRGYYPLLLALYTFYFYIVRNWSRQRGLMRTVREIMASPFSSVTFFHVFVGNYLTSTIKVNQDLCWSLCYFATQEFLEKDMPPEEYALRLLQTQTESVAAINGTSSCQANVYYVNVIVPLICALPLWWRFQQNLRRIYDTKTWWPSLPNAFKYALAQVVSLFGLFHPFYAGGREDHGASFRITWIVLFTLSALYTWAWDVTMDWGLGRPESKLRGYRQMFSRKWIYTVAVIADFFLCFAWTLSLIPHRGSSQEFLLYLQPFTMVAELFRRTMWSFFCLENEHLRNTHGFQQVDFIPLHCEQIGGADAEQKPQGMDPLGGWALLTNILLLTLAVVALSVAAIVIEK